MHNPLDSRHLLVFLELARKKNMGRTAKSLNLTTSAVSYNIKRLEEDLGCKLIDRNSRTMTLTYAGQRLVAVADDMLGQLTRTRYLVNNWSEMNQKSLSIGASPSACQYIVPVALREFKESFPGINIHIVTGTSYQLVDSIAENRVDLAIYPSSGLNMQQEEVSIGNDELHFIVNPIHAWAQAGSFDLNEVVDQRIILTETHSYTYSLVREFFQRYRIGLEPFIEISNEEVIKRLVELDIGIGILPNWIVRTEKERGLLTTLPLGRRKLKRNWVIAYPRKKELSFAETLFVGIVKNAAQTLFADLSVSN